MAKKEPVNTKQNEKPMRPSKLNVVWGFLSALVIFFVPLQWMKLGIYHNYSGISAQISWRYIFPVLEIESLEKATLGTIVAASALIPLYGFVLIEAAGFAARALKQVQQQLILLFFQFSLITFLIFHLLFFILTTVAGMQITREWDYLLKMLQYNLQERLVLTFIVTFIIFGYMSFALARLNSFFSSKDTGTVSRKNYDKPKK